MWRKWIEGKKPMKLMIASFVLIVVIFIISAMVSRNNKTVTFDTISWHKMGEKAHMSFRIKADPKDQKFRLDVWLPTNTGKPVQVSVQLKELKDNASHIEIPMTFLSGGADPYGFEGFDKYSFTANDNLIKEFGEWSINISFTDAGGMVYKYEKAFLISKK
ncbi:MULTISPECIES: hypothetical protein [unclassified Cohnella]|uniref:hypothetical protein n=1 Tax=unclassified Cohnella TaxID=2636738 RepID=UPI00117CA323|nr:MULTISPECIES: hypothetical protein [unclassified Cohnella]